MLQKMYADGIEEPRGLRPRGERDDGVVAKEIDLSFYWRAFKRNRLPIGLFTALVTAAAIYYAQTATPIYAAKATLLLEPQKANVMSIEDLVSSEQESLDYYGTQLAVLRSRGLAERVIRQLQLDGDASYAEIVEALAPSSLQRLIEKLPRPVGSVLSKTLAVFRSDDGASASAPSSLATNGGTPAENIVVGPADVRGAADYEKTLKRFRQSLRIDSVAKTKLVSIAFESADPEFSALAANMVADQYIESVLERRNALEDRASEWMEQRLAQLKLKLDESEETLLSFKRANGLIELDGGVSRLGEQELLLRNAELAEARSEISDMGDLYRKLESYKISSPELLETLPFVQSDVLVRSVKTELGQAQRDLVEARNRYGPKHPIIVDVRSRLESLRSILDGHIERAVTTFENDYQLLQQRIRSLEENVAFSKENIQAIGQQRITLEALEREASANRQQYDRLYDRFTEIRTADGLDEANAVVAEAAWAATDPVKPNKAFIVALAAGFALLLSAFVAFLLEYFDNTVNSAEDIEKRLKKKLLGVLPIVGRESSKRESLLPITPSEVIKTSDTYLEAVNTCRTALSIREDNHLQVILVTSSVPHEGKSTVSLNLAHSFGRLERTLLIDCDLRRPSVARALGLPAETKGLTNVLKREPKNCLRRNVFGSIDCLTSGPVPEQPLEPLSSDRFVELIEKLRTVYDRIIIDSAPTHVVSDALVLSKLADGVLYVVKPRTASIDVINSGLSRLADCGASVVGVCMSHVDIDKQKAHDGFEFHGLGTGYHGYGADDIRSGA